MLKHKVALLPDMCRASADPITLKEGSPVGCLGLEQHTRRRNRVNGHVRGWIAASGELLLTVDQSFGKWDAESQGCLLYCASSCCVYTIQASGQSFRMTISLLLPSHEMFQTCHAGNCPKYITVRGCCL